MNIACAVQISMCDKSTNTRVCPLKHMQCIVICGTHFLLQKMYGSVKECRPVVQSWTCEQANISRMPLQDHPNNNLLTLDVIISLAWAYFFEELLIAKCLNILANVFWVVRDSRCRNIGSQRNLESQSNLAHNWLPCRSVKHVMKNHKISMT